MMSCLLLGVLYQDLLWMTSGPFGVVMRRLVYFGLVPLLEALILLAALPFLEEVSYVFVAGVWEAELLVVWLRAGYIMFAKGDEVDMYCAQYFVNSSLSPVLLFRRRLKSVADVLKGIRNKVFTQSRWDASLMRWGAVCRHGPCGPMSSLHPWDDWIPPDIHGFYNWVFDSLEVLNGFLRKVVVSRRDVGVRKWTRWLREDLSSQAICLALA